jgi:hypothetical protein
MSGVAPGNFVILARDGSCHGAWGVLAYFAVFDESSILGFHCLSLAALQYSTTQSGVCGKWFGWKVIWELDGCEYCRFGTDAVP